MTTKTAKPRRSRAFWIVSAMWAGAVLFALAQNLLA
jgi:hypothetical protein